MGQVSESFRSQCQAELFRRVMGWFGLLLFLASWKLWTPQTVFPQVPFFEVLVYAPGFIDWIALAATFFGLIGMACVRSVDAASDVRVIRAVWCFVAGLSILVVLDQHRLQPWAYQLWILSVLYLTLRAKDFLFAGRVLLVSIYVYSAISKLDYQFANTVGYEISTTLAGFIMNHNVWQWDLGFKWTVAIYTAVYELMIGVLLLVSRRFFVAMGVLLGLVMHTSLLLALGPLGLVHHPPVLLWNFFCMLQLVILFRCYPQKWFSVVSEVESKSSVGSRGIERGPAWLGGSLIVAVVLFPLTSFWGIADHWVSWELYSPRSSRVELRVPIGGAELIADSEGMGGAIHFGKGDIAVDWNSWSLEQLGVPVYPQARFQVGCALELRDRWERDFGERTSIRGSIRSVSDRTTGERKLVEIRSIAPNRLQDHAARYWINAHPRKHSWFWIRP